MKQTRARFAKEYPEVAEVLNDIGETGIGDASDEDCEAEWYYFAMGAGHPRGTKFKD